MSSMVWVQVMLYDGFSLAVGLSYWSKMESGSVNVSIIVIGSLDGHSMIRMVVRYLDGSKWRMGLVIGFNMKVGFIDGLKFQLSH